MTLERLEELGFDRSYWNDDGDLRARCSQCEALTIQGVPCHETGCPHETHECEECRAPVPKGHRICQGCLDSYDEPLEEEELEAKE